MASHLKKLITTAMLLTVAYLLLTFLHDREASWYNTQERDLQSTEEPHKLAGRPGKNSMIIMGKPVRTLATLSHQITEKVKKFVFFVGYPRSGHNIIGALIDAHPHMVVSNEFFLFQRFGEFNGVHNGTWKENLFNLLYQKSARDTRKIRATPKKGYTLKVEGLWRGKFDNSIDVIGDESGGNTTMEYMKGKEMFVKNFRKLQQEIGIPIRVIHAIQNPFDMIATGMVNPHSNLKALHYANLLGNSTEKIAAQKKVNRSEEMDKRIEYTFRMFDAVAEMTKTVFGRDSVLDVHNYDLVDNPRGTILKIFNFLEVEASEHFLDVCAEKVFKSVSQSRNLVVWTPEQKERLLRRMKDYKWLDRYSFTSD